MIETISQLIAQVESGDKSESLRFEPGYHPDLQALTLIEKAQPGLSFMTYETILSCSWGRFQIMGDNLYMMGLNAPIVRFAADPDLQEVFFLRFISRRNIAYTLDEVVHDETKRLNFAHHYNGNANVYAARMMTVWAQSLPPKPATDFVRV